MHAEAREAVRSAVAALRLTRRYAAVLDFGGRDVNGHVRDLFHPDCRWTVIDSQPGEGVDIVADACEWQPHENVYDVAIATEVFEHEQRWPLMLHNMVAALRPGGALVVTAACDPREPHSGIDGWQVREGEWYGNVDPDALRERAEAELGAGVVVRVHPRGDVYVWGRKA